MTQQPRSYECGEVIEPVKGVRITPGLLDRSTAWHASRTALRYALQADYLPFAITRQENRRNSSRLVRIGTFSPADYPKHPEETLVGNSREQTRNRSFMTAVKALHHGNGSDFAQSGYVNIMIDLDDSWIPMHQDVFDRRRSFLQLSGMRMLGFIDPTQTTIADGVGTGILTPGDSHSMRFRDDESSVYHVADYSGEPCSIGIYIDHPI